MAMGSMSQSFYDTLEGAKILTQGMLSYLNNLDAYNVNHLYNEKVLHSIDYEMKKLNRNISRLQRDVDKEIEKEDMQKEGE